MNKKITNILAISILLLLASFPLQAFFYNSFDTVIGKYNIEAMKINNKFVSYSENSAEKQYSDKWPYDVETNQRPYGTINIAKKWITVTIDKNRDNKLNWDETMMLEIVKIVFSNTQYKFHAPDYDGGDIFTLDKELRLKLRLGSDQYEFWLEKD
jgi:hypothetical protein